MRINRKRLLTELAKTNLTSEEIVEIVGPAPSYGQIAFEAYHHGTVNRYDTLNTDQCHKWGASASAVIDAKFDNVDVAELATLFCDIANSTSIGYELDRKVCQDAMKYVVDKMREGF